MMNSPIARQLILPSLCADALALGSHWIYNPAKIVRCYPDGARNYDDPRTEYHPGKSAGDFTHYGDQTLALLKSVVLRGSFDAEGWREDWLRFWNTNPPSYRDGATLMDDMEDLGPVTKPSPASTATQPAALRRPLPQNPCHPARRGDHEKGHRVAEIGLISSHEGTTETP